MQTAPVYPGATARDASPLGSITSEATPPSDTSTAGVPAPSMSTSPSTTASPSTATSIDAWGHPLADPGPAGTLTEADLSKLNDEQLAAVLEAIDDGEVRLAQMAVTRATSPGVKRFAHELLVAYEGMLGKDRALWSRLQLTPTINPTSSQVDADARRETARLAGVSRAQFDREYVDAQVRAQSKVLELFDRILASIKSGSFRAELAASRPKLEGHLRMAEAARDEVQKGVTNRQPSAPEMP